MVNYADQLAEDDEARSAAAKIALYMSVAQRVEITDAGRSAIGVGDHYNEALDRLKHLEKIQSAADAQGVDYDDIPSAFGDLYKNGELGTDVREGLGDRADQIDRILWRAGLMEGHASPWAALGDLLDRLEDLAQRGHFR